MLLLLSDEIFSQNKQNTAIAHASYDIVRRLRCLLSMKVIWFLSVLSTRAWYELDANFRLCSRALSVCSRALTSPLVLLVAQYSTQLWPGSKQCKWCTIICLDHAATCARIVKVKHQQYNRMHVGGETKHEWDKTKKKHVHLSGHRNHTTFDAWLHRRTESYTCPRLHKKQCIWSVSSFTQTRDCIAYASLCVCRPNKNWPLVIKIFQWNPL